MEAIIWLALVVVFLIAEALTVSMISLWFAAGAVVALLLSLLGLQVWVQVVLFFLVSAVLLACMRPLVRRHVDPKLTATNVDAIVGTKAIVTAEIDNVCAAGQIKLNGVEWTARSTTGQIIPEGTLVRVDRIEGVKAFVTPVAKRAGAPVAVHE